MRKRGIHFILFMFAVLPMLASDRDKNVKFYAADHPFIQYTGRIDFSNPKLPRFWQPGVYFTITFKGPSCEVILNDEVLWGSFHNYVQVVVDGKATRWQTRSKTDTLKVAENLSDGKHTLTICKNTEANIGYLELAGIRCEELLSPLPKPLRKIEFIGNSITCGASADASMVPCGKGAWHDQHNAYMSYGAVTSRFLNAQYHLSSVSGIGLMHSCCNMDIVMPRVFDKVSMRNDTIEWNFSQYQPDVVTICLGQNDGIQDSAAFSNNYISFVKKVRGYYPSARLVLLSSPMADASLKSFMQEVVTAVAGKLAKEGDNKISYYFFKQVYNKGCDWHPDLNEHQLIAVELTAHLKKIMKW